MPRRLVFALFLAFLASPASAQLESVGNLRFDTSASKEAQDHFLRGVAILHSFGWKQAIAEFQAAQKIEPDFALAYWGETLCYNHPSRAGTGRKDAAGSSGAARCFAGSAPCEGARRRARRVFFAR